MMVEVMMGSWIASSQEVDAGEKDRVGVDFPE